MNHKARFSFLFNSKTWCRKITTEGILLLNINVTFPILTRFYSTFTQFYLLFAIKKIIYLLFYLLSQISWIKIYSLLLLTWFWPIFNPLILACLLTTSRIYLLSLFLVFSSVREICKIHPKATPKYLLFEKMRYAHKNHF